MSYKWKHSTSVILIAAEFAGQRGAFLLMNLWKWRTLISLHKVLWNTLFYFHLYSSIRMFLDVLFILLRRIEIFTEKDGQKQLDRSVLSYTVAPIHNTLSQGTSQKQFKQIMKSDWFNFSCLRKTCWLIQVIIFKSSIFT